MFETSTLVGHWSVFRLRLAWHIVPLRHCTGHTIWAMVYVQPGEALWVIAHQHCVAAQQLLQPPKAFITLSRPLEMFSMLGQLSQGLGDVTVSLPWTWSHEAATELDCLQETFNLRLVLRCRPVLDDGHLTWVWAHSLLREYIAEPQHLRLAQLTLFSSECQPNFHASLKNFSQPLIMLLSFTINDQIILDLHHSFKTLQHLLYLGVTFCRGWRRPHNQSLVPVQSKGCGEYKQFSTLLVNLQLMKGMVEV